MSDTFKMLEGASLDLKIKLYLTEDGEPCREFLCAVERPLNTVKRAYIGLRRNTALPSFRVILTAHKACIEMLQSDRYDASRTPLLDRALTTVIEFAKTLPKSALAQAWSESA